MAMSEKDRVKEAARLELREYFGTEDLQPKFLDPSDLENLSLTALWIIKQQVEIAIRRNSGVDL